MKLKNENSFVNQNNSSRLSALDIARLIAMLMMVQGHTVFALIDYNIISSSKWYWEFWTSIRGLTAPIFLMVSGAVHIFANKRNADGEVPATTFKKRIKTCSILLIIGYLLQFPANNLYDIPFISEAGLYKLFSVNVLQMFSISLLLLNAVFKLTKNNFQLMTVVFVLGNLFLIMAPLSLTTNWFEILPLPIASFLSMQHGTIFPILPFSGYLFIGSFIGCLIQRESPENRNNFIAKKIPVIAIPYIIIGVMMFYNIGIECKIHVPIHFGIIISRAGFALLAISIAAWLYKYVPCFSRFENIISMFSKRALFIYVIHLLIIYGSPVTPGLVHVLFDTDIITAIYCAFFVIFSTLLIVYIYEKTSKKEKFIQFYKYLAVAILIYILFL